MVHIHFAESQFADILVRANRNVRNKFKANKIRLYTFINYTTHTLRRIN